MKTCVQSFSVRLNREESDALAKLVGRGMVSKTAILRSLILDAAAKVEPVVVPRRKGPVPILPGGPGEFNQLNVRERGSP